jgi:hypothetical protein
MLLIRLGWSLCDQCSKWRFYGIGLRASRTLRNKKSYLSPSTLLKVQIPSFIYEPRYSSSHNCWRISGFVNEQSVLENGIYSLVVLNSSLLTNIFKLHSSVSGPTNVSLYLLVWAANRRIYGAQSCCYGPTYIRKWTIRKRDLFVGCFKFVNIFKLHLSRRM